MARFTDLPPEVIEKIAFFVFLFNNDFHSRGERAQRRLTDNDLQCLVHWKLMKGSVIEAMNEARRSGPIAMPSYIEETLLMAAFCRLYSSRLVDLSVTCRYVRNSIRREMFSSLSLRPQGVAEGTQFTVDRFLSFFTLESPKLAQYIKHLSIPCPLYVCADEPDTNEAQARSDFQEVHRLAKRYFNATVTPPHNERTRFQALLDTRPTPIRQLAVISALPKLKSLSLFLPGDYLELLREMQGNAQIRELAGFSSFQNLEFLSLRGSQDTFPVKLLLPLMTLPKLQYLLFSMFRFIDTDGTNLEALTRHFGHSNVRELSLINCTIPDIASTILLRFPRGLTSFKCCSCSKVQQEIDSPTSVLPDAMASHSRSLSKVELGIPEGWDIWALDQASNHLRVLNNVTELGLFVSPFNQNSMQALRERHVQRLWDLLDHRLPINVEVVRLTQTSLNRMPRREGVDGWFGVLARWMEIKDQITPRLKHIFVECYGDTPDLLELRRSLTKCCGHRGVAFTLYQMD